MCAPATLALMRSELLREVLPFVGLATGLTTSERSFSRQLPPVVQAELQLLVAFRLAVGRHARRDRRLELSAPLRIVSDAADGSMDERQAAPLFGGREPGV